MLHKLLRLAEIYNVAVVLTNQVQSSPDSTFGGSNSMRASGVISSEGLDDKELVISKLLRQDIEKYKSLSPHVSAAIQLSRHPLKGDTIQYIYTDSQHNNPLCRVADLALANELLNEV